MQENFEYENIILSAAEQITECPPALGVEKVMALQELMSKCKSFHDEGFVLSLITAISRKKTAFIIDAKSKTELKEIMEPPKVRYNGNKVVSYGKYSIPEEEAIIWSITSLKAPLNEVGFQRYMLLFKKFFPAESKGILGDRYSNEETETKTDGIADLVIGANEIMDSEDEIEESTTSEDETDGYIDTEETEPGEITDSADNTDEITDLSDKDEDGESDISEDVNDETVTSSNAVNENPAAETEITENAVPAVSAAVTPTVIEINVNTVADAIEKLEKEANTSGGQNVPAIPIYNYLKKVCEKDEYFSALVNQAHKTLLKCFNYVYEQVKNTIENQTGTQTVWVADEAVYAMAEDYYRLDDAEIERRREEEKKKREAEQKAAAEKRKAEQAKRDAERKNKNAGKTVSVGNTVAPVTSNTKTEKKETEQLSLFSFDEEESA